MEPKFHNLVEEKPIGDQKKENCETVLKNSVPNDDGEIKKSFAETPESKKKVTIWTDFSSIIMVMIFYINQGILAGYVISVEVRLTELGATNNQLTLYSYVISPYSFKLFIAPLLDTYYFREYGKRKSYIVPCYFASSFILGISSFFVDDLVKSLNVWPLFIIFFSLVLLISTKDQAVDSWNLSLLHEENLSIGGFGQRFGQVFGTLLGYNLFIWLNSVEYSNLYFWSSSRDYPVLTHQVFMLILAFIYLLVAVIVHLKIPEKIDESHHASAKETCRRLRGMVYNIHLRKYAFLLFFLQAGLAASSTIGTTVLIREKKFDIQKLNFLLLICTPFTIIFMLIGSYFSKIKEDLSLSISTVYIRIPLEICSFFLIYNYDKDDEGYFMVYIGIVFIINAFALDLDNCASGGFVFRIAECNYGATITTYLYSIWNFSLLWPKIIALQFLNIFSYPTVCFIALVFQLIFVLISTEPFIQLEKVPREEWDPGLCALPDKAKEKEGLENK